MLRGVERALFPSDDIQERLALSGLCERRGVLGQLLLPLLLNSLEECRLENGL